MKPHELDEIIDRVHAGWLRYPREVRMHTRNFDDFVSHFGRLITYEVPRRVPDAHHDDCRYRDIRIVTHDGDPRAVVVCNGEDAVCFLVESIGGEDE